MAKVLLFPAIIVIVAFAPAFSNALFYNPDCQEIRKNSADNRYSNFRTIGLIDGRWIIIGKNNRVYEAAFENARNDQILLPYEIKSQMLFDRWPARDEYEKREFSSFFNDSHLRPASVIPIKTQYDSFVTFALLSQEQWRMSVLLCSVDSSLCNQDTLDLKLPNRFHRKFTYITSPRLNMFYVLDKSTCLTRYTFSKDNISAEGTICLCLNSSSLLIGQPYSCHPYNSILDHEDTVVTGFGGFSTESHLYLLMDKEVYVLRMPSFIGTRFEFLQIQRASYSDFFVCKPNYTLIIIVFIVLTLAFTLFVTAVAYNLARLTHLLTIFTSGH